MAHPPEKRLELRAAYIGGLPLEAAADKAGVPYATARNWFRDDKGGAMDWDKCRAATMMVAGGGIEQAVGRLAAAGLRQGEALMERLGEIQDAESAIKVLASLSDLLSKLRAVTKGMMPEADQLAIENGAIKAFADLMIKMHPKAAEQVLSTVEAWANGQR